MKILVLGNGQLGSALGEFASHECNVFIASKELLDITDQASLEEVLGQINPDIVVNTAAYTNVDLAERFASRCFEVNTVAPGKIAGLLSTCNTPLIHISSDYVYSDVASEFHVETEACDPSGVYGASKYFGELEVMSRLSEHIILRPSWLFSSTHDCFPLKIMNLLKGNERVRVVSDQVGGPTSANYLAFEIMRICQKIYSGNGVNWGIYNICQGPNVSWFEFALNIKRRLEQNHNLYSGKTIKPCSSSEYPSVAKRPLNSRMNVEKFKNEFQVEGSLLFWEAYLADVVDCFVSRLEITE